MRVLYTKVKVNLFYSNLYNPILNSRIGSDVTQLSCRHGVRPSIEEALSLVQDQDGRAPEIDLPTGIREPLKPGFVRERSYTYHVPIGRIWLGL